MKEMGRLFKTAIAPIFAIDLNGIIKMWNSKIADLTCLQASRVIGKGAVDHVIHKSSQKDFRQYLFRAVLGEIMDLKSDLHMVGGEGESSYAMNSAIQKAMMTKVQPYVEKSIIDLYRKMCPKCLTIADLGCSSGSNSLLPTSVIIEAIYVTCQKLGCLSPEFSVFLNDLPGNDFNSIFKAIPFFYEKVRNEKGDFGSCFIAGVPGSFYKRLFPSRMLWFVHSSASLHWLSQVPPGIEDNRRNICPARTSPPNVVKAFSDQFKNDFSAFLKSRSEEVVSSGCMVLTMNARRCMEHYDEGCYVPWVLLAQALSDMISEGLLEETQVISFNLPYYCPNAVELKGIIDDEGSFDIDVLEILDFVTDDIENEAFMVDKIASATLLAKGMRAVSEPMVIAHFGEEIVEELYSRFAEHVVDDVMKLEKLEITLLLTRLIKK